MATRSEVLSSLSNLGAGVSKMGTMIMDRQKFDVQKALDEEEANRKKELQPALLTSANANASIDKQKASDAFDMAAKNKSVDEANQALMAENEAAGWTVSPEDQTKIPIMKTDLNRRNRMRIKDGQLPPMSVDEYLNEKKSQSLAEKQKTEKFGLDSDKTKAEILKLNSDANPGGKPLTTDQAINAEHGARQQYFTQAKDFIAMRDANTKIKGAAKNPSPAGDLSLIFNYMKILDPGSTVREGEFANAQNAGSAFEKVGALYNNVIKGTRLEENQRKDFLTQADNLYQGQKEIHKNTQKIFRDIATNQKLNPDNVAPNLDFDSTPSAPAGIQGGLKSNQGQPASQIASPKVGTVEEGHRFKGGNPADPNSWEQL